MSHGISIHMNRRRPAPVVRLDEFDGFARVKIECDGVDINFFVDEPEQAAHIVEGFNRAFPRPVAEAAE